MASRPLFSSAPGLAAAIALGVSDVLAKIIIASRCDVLTMLSFRSVVGLAFMSAWLRFGPRPAASARVRWISIAIGILFAALIFCLFKAIEFNDVPTAVLTYFVYPLLTGLVASATGLERLRWQGVVCALVAFLGLGIMIGAHPAGLAFIGIAYAIGAACCPDRRAHCDPRFHRRRALTRSLTTLVFGRRASCRVRRHLIGHLRRGARRANQYRLGCLWSFTES